MSESGTSFAMAQARIAEIQARFLAPAAPKETNSAEFASALNEAQSLYSDGDTAGDQIVEAAKKYLGIPYKWGGTDPRTGLDCSSFVQNVFKEFGISLPRVSADQARQGKPVASLADAKPGDLVAFDRSASRSGIDHIGIYIGDGKMIVAPKTGDVIKIQKINDAPVEIRRIVGNQTLDLNSLTGSNSFSPMSANLGKVLSAQSINLPSSLNNSGLPSGAPLSGLAAYRSQFLAAGQKYGVDPNLLAAVAKAESNFNPSAISSAGARGLMQIMPSTAAGLGVDPMNPTQAIDGAARLLASNIKQFGSIDLALAAYNAGGGAVRKYGGIPPYTETQNYVVKVRSYLNQQLVN